MAGYREMPGNTPQERWARVQAYLQEMHQYSGQYSIKEAASVYRDLYDEDPPKDVEVRS